MNFDQSDTLLPMLLGSTFLACLVILVQNRIYRVGSEQTAERRFSIFLLCMAGLFAIGVWVESLSGYLHIDWFSSLSIFPAMFGILAAQVFALKSCRGMSRAQKALVAAGSLGSVALLIWINEVLWSLIAGALLLALCWWIGKRRLMREAATLFVIGMLWITHNVLGYGNGLAEVPQWIDVVMQTVIYCIPGLATIVSGAWVFSAFSREDACRGRFPWAALLDLSLAIILLGCLTYVAIWQMVWDMSRIKLTFIMSYMGFFAGAGTGILMTVELKGRRKWVGAVFTLLFPLAMVGTMVIADNFPYGALTEQHAVQVQAAVERYHERTGSYPRDLAELTPGELPAVPAPMFYLGQGWCYQGGSDFYRLGTIHQDHNFDYPDTLKIYASAGSLPVEKLDCP